MQSSGSAVADERVQRRLAAILAADVVGYSALMERAEEATYAEFERLKRELIAPSLACHDGRLIKTTGDGALAEFASPLAAMRCAVEIQGHLASSSSPLRLRVGLNIGDVIVSRTSGRQIRGRPTWMDHRRQEGRRGRSADHPERSRRDRSAHQPE
jgi:adenylate cyclase